MIDGGRGPPGQFVPQEGAHPAIGKVGTPERVEEDRVEVVVRASPGAAADAGGGGEEADGDVELRRVLEELKKVRALSPACGRRLETGSFGRARCTRTKRWRTTCTDWSPSRSRRREGLPTSTRSLFAISGFVDTSEVRDPARYSVMLVVDCGPFAKRSSELSLPNSVPSFPLSLTPPTLVPGAAAPCSAV